mmetsp:Transcript_6305/g.7777  ORF Transcript_6305/g.7777 Transcript_6305/m.7777 type:complete len:83 (+) Transcript_6305:207-455(+)
MTGFHYGQACKKGHTEIVALLLARDDVNVNAQDYRYMQPSELMNSECMHKEIIEAIHTTHGKQQKSTRKKIRPGKLHKRLPT